MEYYVVDVESKPHAPEVQHYPKDLIEEDLTYFEVSNIMELDDPDWRIFRSAEKAEEWLDSYLKAYKSLKERTAKADRTLPAMLYKRRYLAQAIMGAKTSTVRGYCKKWKPGQLFNFHDQTFFVTVRLKSIKQIDDQAFEYKYEIV